MHDQEVFTHCYNENLIELQYEDISLVDFLYAYDENKDGLCTQCGSQYIDNMNEQFSKCQTMKVVPVLKMRFINAILIAQCI